MIFFAIQTPGSPKWITRVIAYEVMSPYTWSHVTLPRTGFWGGILYFPLFFLNLGDERVTIPKCNFFNASLANFLSSLLVCEIDKSLPCPNGEKRHAGGNVTNGKRIWDTTSNNKSHQFTGNWGLCIFINKHIGSLCVFRDVKHVVFVLHL